MTGRTTRGSFSTDELDRRCAALGARKRAAGQARAAQPVVVQRVAPLGKDATAEAATGRVTCGGHGLRDDDALVFTSLAGGAPLAARTVYFAREVSGATFKVAATRYGQTIDITSDMTAGKVRRF